MPCGPRANTPAEMLTLNRRLVMPSAAAMCLFQPTRPLRPYSETYPAAGAVERSSTPIPPYLVEGRRARGHGDARRGDAERERRTRRWRWCQHVRRERPLSRSRRDMQ